MNETETCFSMTPQEDLLAEAQRLIDAGEDASRLRGSRVA